MRVLLKSSWAVSLWLLSCLSPALADSYAATIERASFSVVGKDYLLSAQIHYALSDKATEALKNGVSLYWDVQIKIERQRDYWWDETLAEKTIRFKIQYYALFNMYRIRNEGTAQVDNFSTLEAALEMISTLQDIPVISKSAIDPDGHYVAGLRVVFDREALPLPLRPESYINPQWYLSSAWHLWTLTD